MQAPAADASPPLAPADPPRLTGSSSDPAGRLVQELSLYKGLVEVSALINAITDYEELLTAVMDIARRVMGAEGSALILKNERTGELEIVVARTPAGELLNAHQVIPTGRGIAGWVFEHAQNLLVPDAYADDRFFQDVDKKTGYRTRSILAVPLRRGSAVIGVLEVLNCLQPGKLEFDRADLEALEVYAHVAATAIEKLRFMDGERRRAQWERELSIATEIQQNFLPRTLPRRDDVCFAAHYRPAREVGGDFYDLYETGPDELYFVIGDVAGKGIPAALLMAQAVSALRLIIAPGVGPAAALARWNDMLRRQAMRGLFITAALGRITPSRRAVEIAIAGHCPPLLIRPGAEGAAEPDIDETRLERSPPLAVLSGVAYAPNFLWLSPGDTLLFYTDGLTDSRAPTARGGESLDIDGARAMLKHSPAHAVALVQTLAEGEARHRADAPPQDDLTLLAFGFP